MDKWTESASVADRQHSTALTLNVLIIHNYSRAHYLRIAGDWGPPSLCETVLGLQYPPLHSLCLGSGCRSSLEEQ